MISTVRTMLTCHWSARRLQRYLDADPSALLPPEELRRLEIHLAVCRRCQQVAEDSRTLSGVLALWSQRRAPDPAVVRRLEGTLERLVHQDQP